MSSRARRLILGFALVGLALATYSSWVHYRLLTDPTYVSPCDINQRFNCTQVYLSRFGSVRGVPVALGGVLWFALVALVAGWRPAPPPKSSKSDATPSDPVGGYLFALATIGLAVILYLGYASFVILKTGCILCMGTYVCVTAIFITAGLSASGQLTDLPGRLVTDLRQAFAKPAVLVVAVLFVLGATTVVAWFPREMRQAASAPQAVSDDVEASFTETWNKQPRVDLGVPADGARVIVVKFNDWMCPACKAWQMAYQPIFDKYQQTNPGAVRLVPMDWPWNSNCNSNVTQTFIGHDESCNAAVAVRLARDHGRAEDMISWLFGNQERLDALSQTNPGDAEKEIRTKASQLTGVKDFAHEYAARMNDIAADVATGRILAVNSTPTYFINGVRITNAQGQQIPPQYFDLAIKVELKRTMAK